MFLSRHTQHNDPGPSFVHVSWPDLAGSVLCHGNRWVTSSATHPHLKKMSDMHIVVLVSSGQWYKLNKEVMYISYIDPRLPVWNALVMFGEINRPECKETEWMFLDLKLCSPQVKHWDLKIDSLLFKKLNLCLIRSSLMYVLGTRSKTTNRTNKPVQYITILLLAFHLTVTHLYIHDTVGILKHCIQ